MICNHQHQTDKGAAIQIKQLFLKHTAEHLTVEDKLEYGNFNFAVEMRKEYGATAFESGILFELLLELLV